MATLEGLPGSGIASLAEVVCNQVAALLVSLAPISLRETASTVTLEVMRRRGIASLADVVCNQV
jgi:hypothetical protein